MIIEYGTPVRFLARLGAIERGKVGTATRFVGTIEIGQLGLYQNPFDIDGEPWHIIQFGAWDIPVDETDFEVVG